MEWNGRTDCTRQSRSLYLTFVPESSTPNDDHRAATRRKSQTADTVSTFQPALEEIRGSRAGRPTRADNGRAETSRPSAAGNEPADSRVSLGGYGFFGFVLKSNRRSSHCDRPRAVKVFASFGPSQTVSPTPDPPRDKTTTSAGSSAFAVTVKGVPGFEIRRVTRS